MHDRDFDGEQILDFAKHIKSKVVDWMDLLFKALETETPALRKTKFSRFVRLCKNSNRPFRSVLNNS